MKRNFYPLLLGLLISSLVQAQNFLVANSATGFNSTISGLYQGDINFSDVNNDGKPDMLVTGYDVSNNVFARLYTNSGTNFNLVSGTPFDNGGKGAVVFGDVNNDGKPDVLITGEKTTPSSSYTAKLYTNSGTNFTEVVGTPFAGTIDSDAAFADVNNDSFLDVLIIGKEASNTSTAKLYTNSGTNFTEVVGTPFAGVNSGAVAFEHVNNDAYIDVIITGYTGSTGITKLYTNSGSNFIEVMGTPFAQVSAGAKVVFLDANSDGKSDIFLSGADNIASFSKLYTNSGSNFSEVATPAINPVNGGSLLVADFNNDSKPDIFLSGSDFNLTASFATIYTNTGGNFGSVAGTSFYTDASVAAADINADGKQDLFFSGNDSNSDRVSKAYLNIQSTSITVQPMSVTLCGVHTFGVTASGTALSYAWSNGATTQSMSTSVSGTYFVTVTGAAGSIVSNAATLLAQARTQITAQPIASAFVCTGASQTLSVVGTGLSLSYLWSNGASTTSIITSVLGNYFVTVSGTCGKAVSIGSSLSAAQATTITTITSALALVPGSITDINVQALGTNLSYLWNTGATTAKLTGVSSGEYLVTITGACGIAKDSRRIGNYLIAVTNNGYTWVTNFGSRGSEANHFDSPYSVALGADGKIYVVDKDNHRVCVWSKNGNIFTPITTFGSKGSGANELNEPWGINIAPDGKIYVADKDNKRISVWTQNGNTYTPFATFGSPGEDANQLSAPSRFGFGLDGKIYIADQGNHRISVWTLNGNTYTHLTTFGSLGLQFENDKFNSPSSVWVTKDGKIYISDANSNRISVWIQSGNSYIPYVTFGSRGVANNQLKYPNSVSVANDSKIYVADTDNNRISVWTQSGTNFGNLSSFGSYGFEDNQLSRINNIAISSDAKTIYIADIYNNRISVWKAPAPIFYLTIVFDIKTPTTFSGNTAKLTWPTVAGMNTYCIRISKNNTFDSNSKVLCGLTGNSYTYTQNEPNFRTEAGENEYYFQVAGEDAEGNKSQWSETQTFYLNGATSLKGTSASTSFSIYPNPNAGTFLIDLQGFENLGGLDYTISSIEGKVLAKGSLISGKNEILTALSKGIYFVKVGNGVKKLVIE